MKAALHISQDEIRRGLAADQFAPYFQPKVALRSRRIAGAEALVRWLHPTLGVLSSRAFLSVAHEARLLDDVLDVVLAKSAACCAAWRRDGIDLSVSVNIPIASLLSCDLPPRLAAIVAARDLAPAHVVLEVTEDGWLRNHAPARDTLIRLRQLGFGLSIADFGTGYSTERQLLQAPFNEMKVDPSFVRSVPEDRDCAAALTASIALARRLGLTVAGEGIETDAQWRFLEAAGCDLGQGYFIARPMPGAAFAGWATAWNRQAAPA